MKRLLRYLIPPRFRPYNYLKCVVEEAVRDGVAEGPFKGMRYPEVSVCSTLYPKLLGTYEMELHPVLREIMTLGFRTVIDIGAAEGYYACGMARALPEAHVVAFESDIKGRYLLDLNINLNALEDRVTVKGFCDPALLSGELSRAPSPVLVICDAEGHEYDLLSPSSVGELRHSWILVELHEFDLPGITNIVKDRFGASHQCSEYKARSRTHEDFPIAKGDAYLMKLPYRYFDHYLNEERPPDMNWLWMRPKAGRSDP
jgi:hypothetical protein